jgi:hypothetical protein
MEEDLDWTEMYYRDCGITNCTKSAHWETICAVCKKHICDGHIGYHSRTCVACVDAEAIQYKKDRQRASYERQKSTIKDYQRKRRKERLIDKIEKHSRMIRSKERKKLKQLAVKQRKKEKLESENKSELDIYFEISFFRKMNLHRIRRKKQ